MNELVNALELTAPQRTQMDQRMPAQVHCLKPEGVAAGALPTIAAETARLSGEAREELDHDPFADLAELDENDIDDD